MAAVIGTSAGSRSGEGQLMVDGFVQEIQATLGEIEQQEALWEAHNFVKRLYALDRLAWQILERIENVLYVHGYRQELGSLYHRAEELWQSLDAVNGELFHRLREQLVTAPGTGTTLPQLCETYVGSATPRPKRMAGDEDYLDVFVNGVLDIGQAPPESRDLQSGMIGYVPTPTRVIFALIEHLQLSPAEVFYDIGSGLGRVPLLVGLLTPAQARGIEVEPAYCVYAQQRAESLHLPRVAFINRDARQADYADGTTFFLYTPCTGRMLQEVLDRLHQETRSHTITIAAYGLCTEHVAQQDWLQPTLRQVFDHDTLALFTRR
jgi:precorrin-6B methylase 2